MKGSFKNSLEVTHIGIRPESTTAEMFTEQITMTVSIEKAKGVNCTVVGMLPNQNGRPGPMKLRILV